VSIRLVALRRILFFSIAATTLALPALAQNATWRTAPATNDFNSGPNWSGGSVPTGTASFGQSTTTGLALSASTTLGTLRFNAGAPAYTITLGSGNSLGLTGAGIVNNSANAPTLDASDAVLQFGSHASAGDANIINNSGAVAFFGKSNAGTSTIAASGGAIAFVGNSSAGNSTITATNGSSLQFLNNAHAGAATITLNNGSGAQFISNSHADTAHITLKNVSSVFFGHQARADQATITVKSGSGLGFFNQSSADNATIRAAANGTVLFFDRSTGGNARFIADHTGVIDFSGSSGQNGVFTAGSIEGSGLFLIGNNFEVGGNNRSTEVSGEIGECGCTGGSLTKVGTGTLILSGNNSYTGATTVAGGTLQVDGSIATSSTVTVKDGGALSGTGSVSNVVVKSGGVLAPGDTVGTLHVRGNLTFKEGSDYAVDVTPSQADKTVVTGQAKLDGTVFANLFGGQFVTRQFTILTANGGRIGRFDDVDLLGVNGFRATLSYTATDVLLNLQAALGAGQGNGFGGNQKQVSHTINSFFNNGGALPPAFVGLFGLNRPALAGALTQLSGEAATGAPTVGFQSMNVFLNAMLNPFAGGHSVAATRGFAQVLEPQAVADAPSAYAMMPRASADKPWSLWATSYGSRSNLDGDSMGRGSHDVQIGNYGIIAGADYKAGGDTWLGFAVSGGSANWDLSNSLGGGDSDFFQAGAYGVHNFGAAYIATALGFGWHHIKTDRTVTIAGSDNLVATFDGQNLGARFEGGYRIETGFNSISPYAALQAQNFWLPSYRERAATGAPTFALNYKNEAIQALRTELGAWFEKAFGTKDTVSLALRGRLAWAHDANDDARVTASFQSLPGASFVVVGAKAPKDSALLSAAAELRLPADMTVSLRLDSELAGSARSYAASAELRKFW
jgi:autotransporter-associated beta strand protein